MKERLIKKFDDEIQALDRELKLELPKEIKRARELGDLRENAEYQAAKERQRLVESRISMLQKRVSEIHLLNTDRIPTDRVGFGSTIHVTESTGDKLVLQLVMPEDADAAKGMISTTSPIGRALLNKETGDSVTVVTPGGIREFDIDRLFTIHHEAPE
ncbi:MAG: transcription elongation factor GreA [Vicinamibacterales bacterium]